MSTDVLHFVIIALAVGIVAMTMAIALDWYISRR